MQQFEATISKDNLTFNQFIAEHIYFSLCISVCVKCVYSMGICVCDCTCVHMHACMQICGGLILYASPISILTLAIARYK